MKFLFAKISGLNMQLQMDFDYEEECEGSNDNMLADKCQAAAEQGCISTWLRQLPRDSGKMTKMGT
jgi:hypothetical protein